MSKLLTVFGATGNQGGSVIASVLANPTLSKQFRIRAITRDPSKPSGVALAAKGVQVVKADMQDPASLRTALEGSNAVFAVTNFWESTSKAIEVAQGRNIADAAKAVGVEHLVWSKLPDVTEISGGALPNVDHFDGKAEIDRYMRGIGLGVTSFVPGFYMENLKTMIRKDDNGGQYTFALPIPGNTKIPYFSAAADTGKFVASILLHPKELLGGMVYGASGWWTLQETVEVFERVTGKPAIYKEIPADVWKSFIPNEKLAQELYENFLLIKDYKYFGPERAEEIVKESVERLPERPQTLEEFLAGQEWPEETAGAEAKIF